MGIMKNVNRNRKGTSEKRIEKGTLKRSEEAVKSDRWRYR